MQDKKSQPATKGDVTKGAIVIALFILVLFILMSFALDVRFTKIEQQLQPCNQQGK